MLKNEQHVNLLPSPWVERFAGLIRDGGHVLDVACGSGRHSHLCAARGHSVTAIDRDISRLEPADNITGIELDLESGAPFALAGQRFDGIVVTNYLWRPLIPDLIQALTPGGVLIYETFALGNEKFGKPRNPDHLLAPGELLAAVAPSELVVMAYEHGEVSTPTPSVRQRICAKKP